MATFERLVARINRLFELIVIGAYVALVADITAAVFFRYVLNDSLVWGEELARYLFVWLVFLGAGLGVGKNVHVGIDSFVRMLSPGPQKLMQLGVEVAVTVFLVAFIVVGVNLATASAHMQTLLLNVSIAYVYLAAPVGGALMLINLLANAWRHLDELTGGGVDRC